MPGSRFSTFCVSASVSASVEFSGMVIAIGNCGLDDWSRRLTRSRGISAIDPAWLVAHRIVGT